MPEDLIATVQFASTYCIVGNFGGSLILAIFSLFAKLNPPFSSTVRMLNDTCLLIHQISQPQQMRDLPNFNTSKYTHYTVLAAQNKVILMSVGWCVRCFITLLGKKWQIGVLHSTTGMVHQPGPMASYPMTRSQASE